MTSFPIFGKRTTLILFVAVFICSTSFIFFSQPEIFFPRKASIVVLEGITEIKRSSGHIQQVASDTLLRDQDSVITKDNSKALVYFSNNSSILISPNSEVKLEKLPANNDKAVEIRQVVGETWSKVVKGQGTQYQVKSETTIAAVRGTIFKMKVDVQQNTSIEVKESKVEVFLTQKISDSTIKTLVHEGNKISLPKDKVAEYKQRDIETAVVPTDLGNEPLEECLSRKVDEATQELSNPEQNYINFKDIKTISEKCEEESANVIQNKKQEVEIDKNNLGNNGSFEDEAKSPQPENIDLTSGSENVSSEDKSSPSNRGHSETIPDVITAPIPSDPANTSSSGYFGDSPVAQDLDPDPDNISQDQKIPTSRPTPAPKDTTDQNNNQNNQGSPSPEPSGQ
jgi:hypothetical protein